MKIQWYPGHMTKAKRAMQEDLRIIDLLIEILDARVPRSSMNPDLLKMSNGKFRMVILNKVDLAEKDIVKEWVRYFSEQNISVVEMDARKGNFRQNVKSEIKKICLEKTERDKKKGIRNRPCRAMVVGVPNVGKSTFINTFSGRASLKTGNKPGVTRGNQWIRFADNVELLDTPGVLWPKFSDDTIGTHLAMIGSINDEVFDITELALEIIDYMNTNHKKELEEYYHIETVSDRVENLRKIGESRKALKKGGEIDILKTARLFVTDFRNGAICPVSLEKP